MLKLGFLLLFTSIRLAHTTHADKHSGKNVMKTVVVKGGAAVINQINKMAKKQKEHLVAKIQVMRPVPYNQKKEQKISKLAVMRPSAPGAMGDPQIVTHDHRKYYMDYLCDYVMMVDCKYADTADLSKAEYYIVAKFGNFAPGDNRTAVESLVLRLKPYILYLKMKSVTLVHDNKTRTVISTFPYEVPDVGMTLLADGFYVVVRGNYNFDIAFHRHQDGNKRLFKVHLYTPFTYSDLCGLLGSYNGNPADDFKMRNGEISNLTDTYWDTERFVQDWKTDPQCDARTGKRKKKE